MQTYQILTLVIAIMGTVMLPLGWVTVRGIIKITRVESRLENIAENIQIMVTDNAKIHQDIVEQMREDRKATNERLRYLELHAWGAKLCISRHSLIHCSGRALGVQAEIW